MGVEKAEIPRGTVINGKQMYVEYQIPRVVKHPYPIVLVHGGGGQGTDWMCCPDGRPGWATLLVQEGYKVYVVDRPGHGRSPYHPDLDGPFPQQNITLDQISSMFTPQRAKRPDPTGLGLAKLHNQWPGTGEVGVGRSGAVGGVAGRIVRREHRDHPHRMARARRRTARQDRARRSS